jgi:Skp family chaperone for outer membrane proteins
MLLATAAASAQTTIVKEGVVDTQLVIRAFFQESKQWRDQQGAVDQYTKRIADFQRQIQDLQSQRLVAADRKDSAKVEQIDRQIQQANSDLQYYKATEGARMDALMASLVVNDQFLRNLLTAVHMVAEEQGFLTVKKLNADFLYVAPEVDITEQVIAKMRDLQASTQ